MAPFSQQPTIPPCPACGGRRVAGKKSWNLSIEGGLVLRSDGIALTLVPMVVCTACGQITMYAETLAELHEVIQKHPERFRW